MIPWIFYPCVRNDVGSGGASNDRSDGRSVGVNKLLKLFDLAFLWMRGGGEWVRGDVSSDVIGDAEREIGVM